MSQDCFDLQPLLRGDKQAWDRFILLYARVIFAAVHRRLVEAGRQDEVDDVAQDVFLRLCKSDYRLLRSYDPARAGLSTWLTVVASSAAIDHLRRLKRVEVPLEALPEVSLAVEPRLPVMLRIPPDLLSPRQALVLELLYRRDLEVADAAEIMGVDRQTVRSMHHKALSRLRSHFREDGPERGG